MGQVNEESFFKDVANHKMTVISDNGDVNRHIRFAQPGSSNMQFDLVTWPGYLCYTGDMGTFVFKRLHDMFDFFRNDKPEYHKKHGRSLPINRQYWHEKLEAVDRCDGSEKYSQEKFVEIIADTINEYLEDHPDIDAYEFKEAVSDDVLSMSEFESEAYHAANDFKYNGKTIFTDFFEHDLTEYTDRFTWCCYAIVWGIDQYYLRQL